MDEKPITKAYADANVGYNITYNNGLRPIMHIAPDGALFWHGREVTTDQDFKAAMLTLARYLRGEYSDPH